MEIKNLIESANASGSDLLVKCLSGKYSLFVKFNNKYIECTNRTGENRRWFSLDVLFKHINKQHYSGNIVIKVSQQEEFL